MHQNSASALPGAGGEDDALRMAHPPDACVLVQRAGAFNGIILDRGRNVAHRRGQLVQQFARCVLGGDEQSRAIIFGDEFLSGWLQSRNLQGHRSRVVG